MYNRLATYMQEFFETVRKNIGAITIIALFLLIISIRPAHASIIDIPIKSLIEDSLANFFYSLQTMASWLIFLAGALLNFSINLTMHIKDFVSSTESVYTVWKTIRDISGIFIIGTLLYTAIMMIIGSSKPLGGLIKNIVIAGVLINFSFFLTGVAIDASNIVSLQLYNAIAPQQSLNTGNVNDTNYLKNSIAKSKADGGLSTIFMQSLGITRLYNPDGSKSTAGVAADGKSFTGASAQIILIGLTSVIIMITAALSFFLASLAFIVRFVILIALLAFSPIWFASFIVPEIDKYAGKWRDTLKSQLVFMPVYLLLMYFALSILTSSSIFKNGYSSRLTPSGDFWSDLMVLAINAVLVITMLNLPLLGAISMGAIMPGWAKNVGADAIWKKVGGWAGGTGKWVGKSAYEGTVSRAASAISRSEGLKNWASGSVIGELAFKGVKSTAKNYDEKLARQVKSRTDFAASLGHDKRAVNDLQEQQRQLRLQQAQLRAANNTAGADALNARIQAIDTQIAQTETRRQRVYAQRTDTAQVDTLWTKVARKDRLAANKIQIEAVRRQLTQRQQALQRAQDRANNIQNSIDTLDGQIRSGQARNPVQAQTRLAQLRLDLPTAHARITPLMQQVHDLERQIEDMEAYS